jgi:hypothetical protein
MNKELKSSAWVKFWHFVRHWLWIKPTSKQKIQPLIPKAVEVIDEYIIITYKEQKINLRKCEVDRFNALSRKDKRKMSQKFADAERKGAIRFETINGKVVAIKNKDYEAKANIRK